MRKAVLPIALLLVSACDLPPPTPEEEARQQQQEAELDEQQQEFQLNSSCFEGDKKACDELDKLREAEGVGDIIDGIGDS